MAKRPISKGDGREQTLSKQARLTMTVGSIYAGNEVPCKDRRGLM